MMMDNVIDVKLTTPKPRRWMVLILHDELTPPTFVNTILITYFGKTLDEAIMLITESRLLGRACVGIYSLEVAETKISMCSLAARHNEFPLRVIIEPISRE